MSAKSRTVTRKTELRHMTVRVSVTKTRHQTTHYRVSTWWTSCNFRYYFCRGACYKGNNESAFD